MGKKSTTKKNRPAGNRPLKNLNPAPGLSLSSSFSERPSILTATNQAKVASSNTQKINLLEHMEYVRSDIVRIMLLLIIVALLLLILTLLNDKSTLLQQAGRHLSSFLRLR